MKPEFIKNILFCLCAMFFFASSDVFAKQMSVHYPALQLAWFRYFCAMLCCAPLLFRPVNFNQVHFGGQIIRGIGMSGATVFLIAGIGVLPLAEATALCFVSPVFVISLSVLFLKENVRFAQWLQVLCGIIGMCFILRPGFSAIQMAALFPLFSAMCWACALVFSKRALMHDKIQLTALFSTITGFSLLTIVQPWVFVWPDKSHLFLLLLMGLAWCIAHIFIILAYTSSDVPVSKLAPFSYTQLIWATIGGYIFFNNIPNITTIIGSAIIILSGIWAVMRRHA